MDTPTEQGWGRERLVAILVAAVLTVLLLLAGLGYTVMRALGVWDGTGSDPADQAQAVVVDPTEDSAERRAQIATAPMLQVDPEDARPGEVSATPAPTITVPVPTRTGPVDVPAGLPATPEGAVAQLAAIDTTVLQAMSIPVTHRVYEEWSTGADPVGWVMTQNVQAFLTSAEAPGQSKQTGLAVVVTPVGGQVKGVDGQDWVLACVLLDVRAVQAEEARMAYGHCEAMTWHQDRWVIDSDHTPAAAPSTWPGTDLAAEAGWRSWVPASGSSD